MNIFRSFEEAAAITSPVVTTGSFDGVHIGHRVIIHRLNSIAREIGGESVVITFHPHPRKVLHPDTSGRGLMMINSLEEKLILLEEAGLDNLIIIEFTREFAATTSEEFVGKILTGILGARVIVVGFNHHFGKNQEGDYKRLWEWQDRYNFRAEEIPVQEVQEETVSSTRIRESIAAGYIQKANAYLNHFYIIRGSISVGSDQIPAYGIRMFTVSVSDADKLLPPPGFYLCKVPDAGYEGRLLVIEPAGEIYLQALDEIKMAAAMNPFIVITLHKQLGVIDQGNIDSLSSLAVKAIDDINNLIF